jgi:hypothetical protein
VVNVNGIEELVTDKGYHSGAVVRRVKSYEVRGYIPEKKQKGGVTGRASKRNSGRCMPIYFFDRSLQAMTGSDRVRILVARVVEMHDLLQALEVAVVKESFLKIGSGGLR